MRPTKPSTWTRTFKVPFWLALTYIAVLGIVATFPPRDNVQRVSAEPTATPASERYAVCGIDQTSDPKTGRCVALAVTPLPCVQGSRYDAKAGFCMPVAPKAPPAPPPAPVVAPQQPQAPADPFANLPGIRSDDTYSDPWWND